MKPVIVYNYPKEIKSFYMRLNDDQKTVAAMDILVPKVNNAFNSSICENAYRSVMRTTSLLGSIACELP